MFVKMSLRDRLGCLVDFVGMILLAVFFLLSPCLPAVRLRLPSASSLPLALPTALLPVRLRLPSPSPNCFFRVYFPTLFAAVLKFFLPLTTSAISGTAKSNKSAPTRFAAGTIYLRKKWNFSSPNNLSNSPKSPSPQSSNRSIVWNFYLS